MAEKSLIGWSRRLRIQEAYSIDFWTRYPLTDIGIQHIELRVAWHGQQCKATISLEGMVEQWLRQGKLEKGKTFIVPEPEARRLQKRIKSSGFWKPWKGNPAMVRSQEGSTLEIEGWQSQGAIETYRKIQVWNLETTSETYQLFLAFLKLIPEEILPCDTQAFLQSFG